MTRQGSKDKEELNMNRSKRPRQNQSYADYSGYEKKLPIRLGHLNEHINEQIGEDTHKYGPPLEDDQFGEYPRHGKNLNRTAHSQRNFTGLGPKGYRRPDERILDDVCEALARDQFVDASEIVVKVEGGIVILSGTVENHEDCCEAEISAKNIFGVKGIENNIKLEN